MNYWKIKKDGKTYLKVVLPSDQLAGESLWVLVIEGDDHSGVGTIANKPTQSDLKYGNKITYGGGTRDQRPKYIGLISEPASRPTLPKNRHLLLHVELSDEQLERLGHSELKDVLQDVPADKISAITGETELNRCLIERGESANVWSVDDIEAVAQNRESRLKAPLGTIYDRTKFREALREIVLDMNPEVGITWDVIDDYLEEFCREDV